MENLFVILTNVLGFALLSPQCPRDKVTLILPKNA